MILQLVLGAVLGAIISAMLTVLLDYERQPKLTFSIEAPPYDAHYGPGAPATEGRYLRLRVSNEGPWSRWMLRLPATQCRAEITFHHLDGQNVLGRTMAGRWSETPEPLTIPIVSGHTVISQIIDSARLTADSHIDIQPGQSTLLDIAARFDADDDCYGWNNEAYLTPSPWRNPLWRLPNNRYDVRVAVVSGGRRWTHAARLVNDLSRQDFRLEPITPR